MTAQKINRRLGNRKTTTGCITCKKRRIKCGEERPSCRRCTSTGRRCDGYKEENVVNRSMQFLPSTCTLSVGRALAMLDVNAQEAQALHFFTEEAASTIAGWNHLDFWTRIVPQLSQSQRAVRHAVIAIGSLTLGSHDSIRRHKIVSADVVAHPASRAFALDQYSKAIQATLATIEGGHGDVGLAAVTCLLFVCIETLQGHEQEAILLLRHGRSALQGWENASTATASVRANIYPVFKSLGLQFMMFDSEVKDQAVAAQSVAGAPTSALLLLMTSLTDARDRLLEILALAPNLTLAASQLKWRRTSPGEERQFSDLIQQQTAIDHLLQAWYWRFRELIQCQRDNTNTNVQQKIASSILLQQYYIMRIWLAGSLHTSECFNDKFMPQFRMIVAEATVLAELTSHLTNKTEFCLEMGTIPALYWTVIKCRHPILRRQALSLLTAEHRQEGLWDSRISGKVGRRVIELEEGLNEGEMDLNETTLADHVAKLPPEENRVKLVRIHLRTTLGGKQGDVVEFHTLPDGQFGSWNIKEEFISL